MRIISLTACRVQIPFVNPFTHARASRCQTDTVLIVLGCREGATGIGEILPRSYLTGESVDEVLERSLPDLFHTWRQIDFDDRQHVLDELRAARWKAGRRLAAFAGWETAVLDLAGKVFGFASADVLGPEVRTELPPAIVIDLHLRTEQLEKVCNLIRLSGVLHVKVKTGLEDDITRVEIVRRSLAPEVRLRLDANAAWTAERAIEVLRAVQHLDIECMEQPVGRTDLEGMRLVRQRTGVPVAADESLCSRADAEALVRSEAADIFNIRVGKCGGILASRDLVQFARDEGIRCHLGTLVGETGVLMQMAQVLGCRVGEFEFLEGKGQNRRLLIEDPVEQSDENSIGFGIRFREESLTRWQTCTPQTFA